MLKDLVYRCRSYRRFYENIRISEEELKSLADMARVTASAANSQVLKYYLVTEPTECAAVFETLGWAGALPDWDGPEEGERPSAYIIMLCDNHLGKNKQTDAGIAAQTMMLGAVEMGYGGCMLANIRRARLAEDLQIDIERFTIELVLALGKPKETVKLVDIPEDGSVKYYRDEQQVHYVPKRILDDIILKKERK